MTRKVLAVVAVVIVAVVAAWRLWPRSHAAEPAAAPTRTTAGPHLAGRATASNPASLAGRVTRAADGGGIAGAFVSLAAADMVEKLSPESPTIVVVADATGAWIAPKVPPGAYVVAATAPGYLPKQLPKLAIGAGEQKTGVTLALDAGGTLVKGTVTDIGGGPIPGARVTVKPSDVLTWEQAEFVAITAADGTYQLALADGEYDATAGHDDYTHVTHDLEVDGKPVTLDFVLTPGGVIRGQVIAKDTNKPLPHAMVMATSRRGRWEGGGVPNTSTDDDGNFTVKGLRPGLISITASGRGYASIAPATVEVGIGEQVENVRVLVDRAYSIAGRVIDRGTKQGVANVHVGAFSMGQGKQALDPDPTDAEGKFEVVGVRPGSYILFAFGQDDVPEMGKTVQVADKDVTGVELELEAGVTVIGRVDPPQPASVSLELAGDVGLANMFEAVKTMAVHAEADAAGAFKLEHVPTGAFKIAARTRAGMTGTQPITIVPKVDQRDVIVHLETRASVSGRVIDTNNAPVAGAEVRAEAAEEQKMSIAFSERGNKVTSGADGSFKIVGLDPGTYRMKASVTDDERWGDFAATITRDKKKQVEVELAAGAERTGVTIQIEARDGVIRGQVIGSDRKPAADAWVTARKALDLPKGAVKMPDTGPEDMDETWLPTTDPVLTGADGKFVITRLRKGTYTVIVDGPRGSSHAEKAGVRPGDSITIELQPLGTLTGHVMLHGTPVTAYAIQCRGPAGPVDRPVSSPDGSYALEHLAPGSYSCDVDADAGTAKGKVDVPPGSATLELQLVPWASITGVVVSLFNGAPVPGIDVVTAGTDGKSMIDMISGNAPKTDATGRFEIAKIAAGKGSVMLMNGTASFKPLAARPYTATEGQRVDLGTIKIVPPRQGDAGTLGITVSVLGPDALGVTYVKPGGPADQSGVKVDDKIKTIDGHTITELTPVSAESFLSSGQIGVGEVVQLGIDRGGQQVSATVTSIKW